MWARQSGAFPKNSYRRCRQFPQSHSAQSDFSAKQSGPYLVKLQYPGSHDNTVIFRPPRISQSSDHFVDSLIVSLKALERELAVLGALLLPLFHAHKAHTHCQCRITNSRLPVIIFVDCRHPPVGGYARSLRRQKVAVRKGRGDEHTEEELFSSRASERIVESNGGVIVVVVVLIVRLGGIYYTPWPLLGGCALAMLA